MNAETMIWLVNWVLPVAGALGLWLTSSRGKWLVIVVNLYYRRKRRPHQCNAHDIATELLAFPVSNRDDMLDAIRTVYLPLNGIERLAAYCYLHHGKASRRLGYALGLVSQPLWLWFTFQYLPETWGPFATSCLYTLAWGRGIIRR